MCGAGDPRHLCGGFFNLWYPNGWMGLFPWETPLISLHDSGGPPILGNFHVMAKFSEQTWGNQV